MMNLLQNNSWGWFSTTAEGHFR